MTIDTYDWDQYGEHLRPGEAQEIATTILGCGRTVYQGIVLTRIKAYHLAEDPNTGTKHLRRYSKTKLRQVLTDIVSGNLKTSQKAA